MRELLRDEDERLKGFAARYGKGRIFLFRCQICGYLDWKCSQSNEPDEVRVSSDGHCPACAEIAQRSPEVFHWVRNVACRDTEAVGPGNSGNRGGFP